MNTRHYYYIVSFIQIDKRVIYVVEITMIYNKQSLLNCLVQYGDLGIPQSLDIS